MRRVRLWMAIGVLVLALAGASLGWLALHRAGGSPRAAGQTRASALTAALRKAQARHVAAALRRLPSDPQALVASWAQAQVRGRARQAIPAGTEVAPDVRSWAPDGVGGGTMLVTITAPGHAPATYDAIMVSEGGQWKVLATIPVRGTR